METPTNKVTGCTEYMGNKAEVSDGTQDSAVCNDNLLLAELKATGNHFKDLYRIAKEQGVIEALKHDIAETRATDGPMG